MREKYKNHPSILTILGKQFENSFCFRDIFEVEIANKILCMNDKKASQQADIPTNILKMNVDIFSNVLSIKINNAINFCTFSFCIK